MNNPFKSYRSRHDDMNPRRREPQYPDRHYDPHRSSLRGLSASMIAILVYVVPLFLTLSRIRLIPIGMLAWLIPLYIFKSEQSSGLVQFHALQATMLYILVGLILLGGLFYTGTGFYDMPAYAYYNRRVFLANFIFQIPAFVLGAAGTYFSVRAARFYSEFSLPLLGWLSHWILYRKH